MASKEALTEAEIAQQTFTGDEDDNARASTSTSTSAGAVPILPTSSDWSTNPHISFDKLTNRYIYEDPSSGKEYEYDETTRAWRETLDESDLDRQQDAYRVEGVDETEQVNAKRKKEETKEERKNKRKKVAEPKQRINSSLFISYLPLDATADEIAAVFSRYGIIAEDDEGLPRIKLYHDDKTGQFKGEALLSFFKPESCALAIQLLDGTCLREALGQRSPLMKVEMADWSKSATTSEPQQSQPQAQPQKAETATSSASSSAPPQRQRTEQEKKRAAKRFARMNDKLQGWDSDSEEETVSNLRSSLHYDGDGPAPTGPILTPPTHPSFHHSQSRTMLLKHLFTPAELTAEPELLLDIKDDIREECNSFGNVTNVVLYDLEEEGIVSVKFARGGKVDETTSMGQVAAREACKKMNGRYFAGKTVLAYLVEGKMRFKRSGKGDVGEEGKDGKDGFGEWLEGE